MTKKTTAIRLLFSSVFLFSTSSVANNFNYTNFEIGFTANPSSFSVSNQFAFSEHAYLIFNGSSRFDGDWIASAGAGFNAPVNTYFDLYGDARIYSIKYPQQNKHDLGELAYGVNLGMKGWILPQIEGNIVVGKIAFDSNETRSVVEIGTRFHSTDAISIGATFRANGIYKGQYYFSVRFEL